LRSVHCPHGIDRTGFAPGQEFVTDLAPGEQPRAVDPQQRVLVDAEARQGHRSVGAAVGHFEPQAGVPRPVAVDADGLLAYDMTQLGWIAVAVLEDLADALLERQRLSADRFAATGDAHRPIELAILGEAFGVHVRVMVIHREQVPRHQVLDLGAVGGVAHLAAAAASASMSRTGLFGPELRPLRNSLSTLRFWMNQWPLSL